MLPKYKVLNAKIDYLCKEEIREMQDYRLKQMVKYVYLNTMFWKLKFDAIGLKPEDINGVEDIGKIPFCDKEELQKDQELNKPYGSYTASHPSTWMKYAMTSGTTGKPLKRVFSQRDWTYVLERYMRSSNIQPGDTSVILGPTDGFMGPMASMDSFAAQGAMVVTAGCLSTKAKIKLIEELKPKQVNGTVSNLLYVGETARQMGINLADIKSIKVITAVGEPGAGIKETRDRILDYWGDVFIHDAYGMTEFFPLAPNCHYSSSLHLANDFVIAEVVDPKTGEKLEEGIRGELVLTNIISDTQPLLRFRTRDIGSITSETCECRATNVRIVNGIEGRVDDMIWFKGVNIFPSAIEGIIRGFKQFGNEFKIVLERKGEVQKLKIQVEVRNCISQDDCPGLKNMLQNELKNALEVTPEVDLLPEGTLPKTEYKAKRIVDLR